MKRNSIYAAMMLILSMILAGCGSGTSDEQKKTPEPEKQAEAAGITAEPEQPEAGMKQVEIYGTVYTIPENWCVEEKDENHTSIYFETPKPEKVHDYLSLIRVPDVLDEGTSYKDSEECILDVIDDIHLKIFDKCGGWKEYNKTETAGRYADGEKEYYSLEAWVFMNSYHDAVVIRYIRTFESEAESYSEQVKKVIDSMQFSYEGFRDPPGSSDQTSKEADNEEVQQKLAAKVYKWCQKELKQYSRKEGKDAEDKYLDEVFRNAASEFNMTAEEIEELYEMAEEDH